MYEISEISTNLFKMYEYPMSCKMLGIGPCAILKKNNVWKSLVDPRCAILVQFSIFSIHLELSTDTYFLYLLYVQVKVLLVTEYRYVPVRYLY